MEKIVAATREGLQVNCTVSVPDFGQVQRVVLGVHGFGGSTRDPIQENIAEEMGLFGSATVRFDFPCHGENPSNDLTLTSCVSTLLCAAQCAREEFPQVADLCVFATGFGAYVTLLALPQLQELFRQVRLVVQTPSVLMHQTLLSMLNLSRQTFRAMDRYTIPTPRPLEITYDFYRELEDNIVLTTHHNPMLILHGEKDDFIPMEQIQNFHRINEDSKLVIIPGTTHRFQEEGAWDMVLDLTRDWFAFQQVLLSDWN